MMKGSGEWNNESGILRKQLQGNDVKGHWVWSLEARVIQAIFEALKKLRKPNSLKLSSAKSFRKFSYEVSATENL